MLQLDYEALVSTADGGLTLVVHTMARGSGSERALASLTSGM
jgi:hypothetical protein